MHLFGFGQLTLPIEGYRQPSTYVRYTGMIFPEQFLCQLECFTECGLGIRVFSADAQEMGHIGEHVDGKRILFTTQPHGDC
jgi:hypothetical protein